MRTRLFHAIVVVGGTLGGGLSACGAGTDPVCDPNAAAESTFDPSQSVAGTTAQAAAAKSADADCKPQLVKAWPPTKC